MSHQTFQKAIKIGDSLGVTLPAKDVKRLGIKPGTLVKVSYDIEVSPSDEQIELVAITQKLIARHQQALKNLSQR